MRAESNEPPRLPFQPGPASNGEFVPPDPSPRHIKTAHLAMAQAEEIARRKRLDRREFLLGLGGMAVTLGAINATACGSDGDEPAAGRFDTPTRRMKRRVSSWTGRTLSSTSKRTT